MENARSLAAISDDELLCRLVDLLRQSRRVESDLVAHIGEAERRRLYAREAFPSMFAYCTQALRLSEAEAYARITVARASRKHPVLLDMLADGRLHLTGIARLAPHLTAANRSELLERATHKSRRQIEALIADLAPRPDAPALMRRLPERTQPPTPWGPVAVLEDAGLSLQLCPDRVELGPLTLGTSGDLTAVASGLAAPDAVQQSATARRTVAPLPALACGPDLAQRPALAQPHTLAQPQTLGQPLTLGQPAPAAARASGLASVQPLGGARYKVQFTASATLHEKLKRLQALMRSQVPDGDLAGIIDRAVTEKLERLEARRFAKSRPRTSPGASAGASAGPSPGAPRVPAQGPSDTAPPSRHIPAATRRAVYERDGGRCRYFDERGGRCPERDNLEYHHRHPFGMGGDHGLSNIRLMCPAHNAYLAEHDYGREVTTRWSRSRKSALAPALGASAERPAAPPHASP